MIVLYLAAGLNHFIHPGSYKKILPPWLPAPNFMVMFSGIAEIVFALLLISSKTRVIGAWGIIALLIAVFPANIQMAINYRRSENSYLWLTLLRLPLQLILIWWAWQYTKTR